MNPENILAVFAGVCAVIIAFAIAASRIDPLQGGLLILALVGTGAITKVIVARRRHAPRNDAPAKKSVSSAKGVAVGQQTAESITNVGTIQVENKTVQGGGAPRLKVEGTFQVAKFHRPISPFVTIPREPTVEYDGFRVRIKNSKAAGATRAAEHCEVALFLPSGQMQQISWVGSRQVETINVDSEKEVDFFAVEANTRELICPTERGYFVAGPDDYVRLGKPPIRASLRVTCANGDPVEVGFAIYADSQGGIIVTLEPEV